MVKILLFKVDLYLSLILLIFNNRLLLCENSKKTSLSIQSRNKLTSYFYCSKDKKNVYVFEIN